MKIKKQPGSREIVNGINMVLKGHDSNGKETWVTAEYFDRPKHNDKQKENRGGKREGSGRPKSSPTVTLSYRVAADKSDIIDTAIRKIISKHNKK